MSETAGDARDDEDGISGESSKPVGKPKDEMLREQESLSDGRSITFYWFGRRPNE